MPMVRFTVYAISISLFFIGFLLSGAAQAAPGGWLGWVWPFSSGDFTRPYLEDGKTPHNSQWEQDSWQPEDWIKARGTQEDVLNDLYAAGIIKEQYMDDDLPVLEVGRNFIRLSDKDKNHVAKFVDHAFGITAGNEKAMYLIELENPSWLGSNYPVGVYTRSGLQLQ